jgi:carboxyl-terminal processing protease
LLDVKNVGTGKALDSIAAIKNVADPNIFIEKGRFKLGEIAPGETKTAKFQLEVKKAYKGDSFPLRMEIIDGMLEEFSTEKLHIAVTEPGLSVESKRMVLRAAEKAEIFDSPIPNAQPFARLPKGGSVSALGKVAGYYKIELEKDRFAFIKQSDAREARAGRLISVKDVEYLPFRDPPQISVNADPQQGGIVVNGDRFTLSGTVSNAKTLLDMYVLVNDKKVFFKSASPAEASQARLKFSTDFALKEGNNYVLVVAREGPDFAGRKALVIRRRPPAVAEKMARP